MNPHKLDVPKFKSQIPDHLLHNLSEKERWLYERMSLQHQQNEWLVEQACATARRLNDGDLRMGAIEVRVKIFEDRWLILTSKWAVIVVVATGLIIPILLMFLGAWISGKFGAHH